MKTSLLDLVFSVTLMVLAAWASLKLTGLFAPASTRWFSEYHIIADALMFLLLFGLSSALALRLILLARPLQPGEYSMDDVQFTIWKLYSIVFSVARGALLPFTTVFTKPLIPKLFGARIGKKVALGGGIADAPLVSVGDYSILGRNSAITAHAIVSGRIILRPVKIGERVTIGVNAVIWPGVEIGDGSIVAAGSIVKMDTRIPANELWGGMPAKKLKDVVDNVPRG